MRFIKMCSLAAIAAVAAMAFVGASSAMAEDTALCTKDEVGQLPCQTANQASTVHLEAVEPPRLLTTSGTVPDVVCEVALAELSVLGLANPLVAHFTTVLWDQCHDTTILQAPCTVENKLLGLALVLKTAPNLAVATLHDTKVFVKCGEAIACTYELPLEQQLHIAGAGNGSTNGHVTAANETVQASANHQPAVAVCPAATWDALYASLTPIYVKT